MARALRLEGEGAVYHVMFGETSARQTPSRWTPLAGGAAGREK